MKVIITRVFNDDPKYTPYIGRTGIYKGDVPGGDCACWQPSYIEFDGGDVQQFYYDEYEEIQQRNTDH